MTSSGISVNNDAFDRRTLLQGLAAVGLVAVHRAVAAPSTSPKKDLIVHSQVPMNAEPALADLVKSWITPNEHFYVRSHAPVPKLDASTFRVSVEGLVHKPLKLTVAQLREQFPVRSVVATMTCAGNRRSEHSQVKQVEGVQWQAGAIGNARWTGTPLSALLEHAGVKSEAKHLWFEGLDEVKRSSGIIPFGGSIPLEKAMTDGKDTPGAMAAYEMNGKVLAPDHGFPLRSVVPGYVGARSVKWLGRIVASDRPSSNHYLATAYKLVTEGTDKEWSAADPIYNYPINSVTCLPTDGAKIRPGKLAVHGYALAPGLGDRTVAKVEVSADGGKTWTHARFTSKAVAYCWRLWSCDVEVTKHTTSLIVRATDSSGKTQPQTVDWNLKGYLFNAWDQTPIRVQG